MALRALMIKKRLDDKRKELAALKAVDFESREADIARAIEEASTEEERSVVDAEIEGFEKDKRENEENVATLEGEISDLERELEDIESNNETPETPAEEAKPEEERAEEPHKEERSIDMPEMTKRVGLYALSEERRSAVMKDEKVVAFIQRARECIAEKRALTNVGLTIPEIMLPMLREIVETKSKLAGKVDLRHISGTGRMNVMGTIPEAVWTEMCATLNELSIGFNDVEVDGYKVGGYFAVCNAVLEDSDIALAQELITCLGASIAKALDKAIIYGTGTKMPLGIVTRLAQTSEPSGYSSTARTWVDYHSSHVLTGTGATGLNLFKEIVLRTKVIKNKYFNDGLIWIMNGKTHLDILAQSMDKNMNASIVAGVASNVMPVVGGEIIEVEDVPDNNVIVGYGKAYLLAERAGTKIGQSEHVRFIEDQTVFKGTARYDGKPIIDEAFAVFTIVNSAPTTSGISFASDTANTVEEAAAESDET